MSFLLRVWRSVSLHRGCRACSLLVCQLNGIFRLCPTKVCCWLHAIGLKQWHYSTPCSGMANCRACTGYLLFSVMHEYPLLMFA